MPLVSVVLVVDGTAEHLSETLGSVLDQAFTDVEVVAVDDAAAQPAQEVLRALASDRLRVLHHDEPVGRDRARRAGLELATGEYVWFVEATDELLSGSLAAVARALSDRPQLLVVGQRIRDSHGRERGAPPVPEALWTKVVRRDLLDEMDGFGLLPQERLPAVRTAWTVVLAAERTARLKEPCYLRRQLTASGADPGVEPAALVEQYDELLGLLDRTPALTGSHGRVLAGMLRQGLALLDHLPRTDRADFFALLSAAYRRHVRGGQPAGGRLLRLQGAALAKGDYRALLVLRRTVSGQARVTRRVRRAPTVARKAARRARTVALDRYYHAQLRLPLDDRLAVYGAYWYAAYSCNPRAIYEKARELAPWVEGVWVVEAGKTSLVPAGVRHVVAGTREYYRTMARATYFINNVNFPNDIVKRPGQIHLQTHHGTPLKTMGMLLVDAPFSQTRLNFPKLLKRIARWDYSISANPFTTEVWSRAYPGSYEHLETGYPRNDALANASAEEVASARAALGIAPGQRSILYAPTHREYTKGYQPLADLERLAGALGPDVVILVRTHYFYAGRTNPVGGADGRLLDVSDHPVIEQLCLAADVLVTDYSSLMFDYAVLDRPIVIYAPDWDVYRSVRGATFDLMAEPPGAVARTEEELADVLASGRAWDDDSATLRAAFRAKYCALEDGKAAERVVRRLWPAPPEDWRSA